MHINQHPHPEDQLFTLTAECGQDVAFIDALHLQHHVAVQGFERKPWENGCQTNVAVRLLVGQTAQALRAKAGSEFASAFGHLMRLSLGDTAGIVDQQDGAA